MLVWCISDRNKWEAFTRKYVKIKIGYKKVPSKYYMDLKYFDKKSWVPTGKEVRVCLGYFKDILNKI